MKDLKALMGNDDSGDKMKKDAKLTVLKQLRQMAADMVGGDVKDGMEGMKKVTVAASDKSGLAEGLAKAKEMLGHGDESEDDESHEDPSEEAHETPEEEASEETDEELTPEEIQAKIADLQKMLAARR